MIGVDLGNEQRHERIHPVVAGVADDEVAGGGEGLLDVAGDRRVERGKHDLRAAARRARLDGIGAERVGNRRGEPPRRDGAVGLAFRSLAGGEPGGAKPGMAREARDELLADDAGGAEDADVESGLRLMGA